MRCPKTLVLQGESEQIDGVALADPGRSPQQNSNRRRDRTCAPGTRDRNIARPEGGFGPAASACDKPASSALNTRVGAGGGLLLPARYTGLVVTVIGAPVQLAAHCRVPAALVGTSASSSLTNLQEPPHSGGSGVPFTETYRS